MPEEIPQLDEKKLILVAGLALNYIYKKLVSFKNNQELVRVFPARFNPLGRDYEQKVEVLMEELSSLPVNLSKMRWGGVIVVQRIFKGSEGDMDIINAALKKEAYQSYIDYYDLLKLRHMVERYWWSDDVKDKEMAKLISSAIDNLKEISRSVVGYRVSQNLAFYSVLSQSELKRLEELEKLHGRTLPGFPYHDEFVQLRMKRLRSEAFWIMVKLYIQTILLWWYPPLFAKLKLEGDFVAPHGPEFKSLATLFGLPEVYHGSSVPSGLRVGQPPKPKSFRVFIPYNEDIPEEYRGKELPPVRLDPHKSPTANQIAIMLMEGYYISRDEVVKLNKGHHCRIDFVEVEGEETPILLGTYRWRTRCSICHSLNPDIYTYDRSKPRIKRGTRCIVCRRPNTVKAERIIDQAICSKAELELLKKRGLVGYNMGVNDNLSRRYPSCQ